MKDNLDGKRMPEEERKVNNSKKSKGRLPKEILVLFVISIVLAAGTYFLLNSTAGTLVYHYCEANDIVLNELQDIQTDYLIEAGSLLASVLLFLILFLFLLGRKLSYLQVIMEGIEALRIHRMDYSIPVRGDNELTDLARSINYLSETERELSEKEKQMKQERELLIRALSHDIRTPLTSIRSYSELMAEKMSISDIRPEEMREYADLIGRKAEQMKELTDQLLDSSKHRPEWMENGRLLMEQLAYEWEEMLEDRFDVRIDMEDCPAFSGEIDVREFQRIFDNLCSNIEKYADTCEPVKLKVGVQNGRLYIWQKNRKKNVSNADSHQIGLLSIKAIAGNYGGSVEVKEDEETYEIRIRLLEI